MLTTWLPDYNISQNIDWSLIVIISTDITKILRVAYRINKGTNLIQEIFL